jgi:hypothetical protein
MIAARANHFASYLSKRDAHFTEALYCVNPEFKVFRLISGA